MTTYLKLKKWLEHLTGLTIYRCGVPWGLQPIRVRLTRNMLKFSPLSKNFHK
jgi:hypothetical protein